MNRRWKAVALGALVCLTTLTIAVAGDLDLSWFTIDGGGEMWTTGGGLELSGTIGQPDGAVEVLAGGDLELVGGFWTSGGRALPVVTPSAIEPVDEPAEPIDAQPAPSP